MKIYPFYVVLMESERGWGQKDFLAYGFETREEAAKKMDEVNSENTSLTAPDYYIQARIETDNFYANYLVENE